MRLLLAALWIAGTLAGSQVYRLVPAPRSLARGEGWLELRSPVRIWVANAEDRLAAETILEELKQTHGREGVLSGAEGATIRLLRVGDPALDREIQALGLDRRALEHEEGYWLHSSPRGVLVASRSAAGVFYGAQTLRQLIGPDGRIPAVSIADWPALRYRALFRGCEPRPHPDRRAVAKADSRRRRVQAQHAQPLHGARLPIPPRSAGGAGRRRVHRATNRPALALRPPLPHRTCAAAADFRPSSPHAEIRALRGAGRSPLRLRHHSAAEETYQWIRQAAQQLAETFPGQFLHIGSDETWELGQGRSRGEAERIGVGRLYVRHLQRVAELLRPLGRRLMFWGDIALSHAQLIPELPQELIAMTWDYEPREDFSAYIEPFRKAGFAFFVCPGLNNWNRIFPNVSKALANIAAFVRDGKRAGALGMFNTHWADDGEALLNQNWYGILYSAAAAWQAQEPAREEFDAAFDWAFYRCSDPAFASVIRRLDEVHKLLRSVGVGDATNRLFWLDPFTPAGAALVAKIAPVASAIAWPPKKPWSSWTRSAPKPDATMIPCWRYAWRQSDSTIWE
jgi:hexosaminidase